MTKFILGLGLLAMACGSSGGNSAPTLDGVWQLQLATGCAATFAFKGMTWTDNVVCELQNGNFGAEVESGAISKTSDTIDFMPQSSSCPAHAHASSAGYAFSSGQLVLKFSDATLILKPAASGDTGSGLAIQNGCWDFSQSPALFTLGKIEQL